MSHEKHIAVRETHETTHLSSEELRQHHEHLENTRHEQSEKLKNTTEVQEARQVAQNEALTSDETNKPATERPATERRTTREDKTHAFKSVMHHVRKDLSKPERTFSKIIHQPVVETASDLAGKTIARPSGVIGATALAAFGLLTIYGIARFAGFQLSGSEMPILLVVGFTLGLLVEWAYKATRSIITSRQS